MSDVYSFGVVLLELISGRRSVDKSRPTREQNLAEWARPMLCDPRKLSRVMDPRLEGQYSETGAIKAAALAYQCLSHRPKQRPTISTVVKTLEPLKDFDDVEIAPFVYTVPTDIANSDKEGVKTEAKCEEEVKKENGHHHHQHHRNHPLHPGQHNKHRLRSPKSPNFLSENGVRQNHRNGLNSPLHQRRKSLE